MHLLEREEEIARQHIAEAVLEDDDATSVMRRSAHLRQFGVATHHGAIGAPMSILELEEEGGCKGLTLTRHLIVLVDGIVGVGSCVFHPFRHVIDKVFRGILDGNILRIAIHAAHIAMSDTRANS